MIAEFRACDSCSKSDGHFLMAATAKRKRPLWDAYAFAGFRPEGTVRGKESCKFFVAVGVY
jgi:hypothetical protein